VFQPPANRGPLDTETGSISYTSRDGIRLAAYFVEPTASGRGGGGPVVLAFHGNATIARWMIPWARELARRTGATVVLPEYRGYDGLRGVPNYEGGALDAAAALAATADHFHRAPSDLVYYGHTLGTAIATELAATNPPRALVLESPFTSARDMAARWPVPALGSVWGIISRVHYATAERVAVLESPVSVAHGGRDVIIPVRMGHAVHAAARRKGGLLIVPEADHNDLAVVGGDAYWQWIREAIGPGSQ
jgi:pimeloyl-ACP methyl ester carboxylesterase